MHELDTASSQPRLIETVASRLLHFRVGISCMHQSTSTQLVQKHAFQCTHTVPDIAQSKIKVSKLCSHNIYHYPNTQRRVVVK